MVPQVGHSRTLTSLVILWFLEAGVAELVDAPDLGNPSDMSYSSFYL